MEARPIIETVVALPITSVKRVVSLKRIIDPIPTVSMVWRLLGIGVLPELPVRSQHRSMCRYHYVHYSAVEFRHISGGRYSGGVREHVRYSGGGVLSAQNTNTPSRKQDQSGRKHDASS